MAGVQTIAGAIALGNSGVSAPPWDAPFLLLYTNVLSPTSNTVLGDLTEPTGLGTYVRLPVTWGAMGWSVTAQAAEAAAAATAEWAGDVGDPFTVQGWGLASAVTAGVLLAVGALDAAFPLLTITDILNLTARLRVNGTADAISIE